MGDRFFNAAIRVFAGALVWLLASAIGSFTADHVTGAAAVYLPVGVLAAITLRIRTTPVVLIITVIAGEVALGALTSNLTAASVANGLANGVEVLLIVAIMRGARAASLERGRDLAWFAVATMVGCFVGASIGATASLVLHGQAAGEVFSAWWASDALGTVLLVPASMLFPMAARPRRRLAAGGVVFATLLLLAVAAMRHDALPVLLRFTAWYVLALGLLFVGVIWGVPTMSLAAIAPVAVIFTQLDLAARAEVIAYQGVAALVIVTMQVAAIGIRSSTARRHHLERIGSELFVLSPAATARVRIHDAGDASGDVARIECVQANDACAELLGIDGQALTLMNLMDLIAAEDLHRFVHLVATPNAGRASAEVWIRLENGERRLVHVSSVSVDSLPGEQSFGEHLLVFEDVTLARDSESRLLAASRIDALTGLLNRASLMAELRGRLDAPSARSDDPSIGLLFIDLDGFKEVNDSYGHLAGDTVLAAVAEAMRSTLRPTDLIGRYGGDEFIVLVEGPDAADLESVAHRVKQAISAPVHFGDHRFTLSCSVGFAIPELAETAAALIARTDREMYEAKRQNRVVPFVEVARDRT